MEKQEIKIIRLHENRWEEYKRLRLKALKEVPQAYGSSYEEETILPDERWKSRLSNDNVISFFAQIDGKLVGMMACITNNGSNTKHIGELVSVYVDDNYQRQGIGKMLLNEILKEAKEKGLEKIELNVVTTQIAAQNLYSKGGFKQIGIAKHALKIKGEYFDEILMEIFI